MSTTQNSRKKNLLTSLVAGAAGVALLAGGASFALWTDTAASADATITSGSLDVSAGAQTWTDVAAGTVISSADFASYKIVPGDTIRMDQMLTTSVDGDVNAQLTVANLAGAIDGPLADDVNCTISVNDARALSGDCATVVSTFTSELVFLESVTDSTTKISLTVDFPKTLDTVQGGMNEVMNLNPITFTLKQV